MGEKWWSNGAWDMHPGFFYMQQICDMRPIILLPFRRKACWGFFYRPLKIRRLRSGLNPRTWVSEASTLPLHHRSRFHNNSNKYRFLLLPFESPDVAMPTSSHAVLHQVGRIICYQLYWQQSYWLHQPLLTTYSLQHTKPCDLCWWRQGRHPTGSHYISPHPPCCSTSTYLYNIPPTFLSSIFYCRKLNSHIPRRHFYLTTNVSKVSRPSSHFNIIWLLSQPSPTLNSPNPTLNHNALSTVVHTISISQHKTRQLFTSCLIHYSAVVVTVSSVGKSASCLHTSLLHILPVYPNEILPNHFLHNNISVSNICSV